MLTLLAILIATVVVLVGAVLLVVVNPTGSRRPTHGVSVEPARLETHVRALARPGPSRSWEHPEILDAAAEYIRNTFLISGYDVRDQVFEVEGNSFRNLIAEYGPDDAPVIVIGAHYDACGDQPAADDNASAVAVLLEIARHLKLEQPRLRNRIELVAFTLEEPPYFRTPHMGSAVHAAELVERGIDVEYMISLEMLGFFSDEASSQDYPLGVMRWVYPTRGDFICVVGGLGGWRLVRRVKAAMKGANELPVHSINAPATIPGIDFSDHLNYWQHGFPAVMITDTAFYRNPNYHLPSDTADTLDYERMARVTEGVWSAITRK